MAQKATPKKTRAPRWQKAFLAALRDSANVRIACQAAKVDRAVVYRRRSNDEAFAVAWDEAREEAADLLEAEVLRRAKDGVQKPVLYKGEPVMVAVDAEGNITTDEKADKIPLVMREYSDTLAIFLLKAARPEKFRERYEVRTVDAGSEVDQEIKALTDELNQRAAAETRTS